ncbi:MAG: hypothetical protein RI894_1755 [Bacteroidota bacterium]
MIGNFPPVSIAEWQNKINKDLKGVKTYDDLIWETPEGLQLAPFYQANGVTVSERFAAASAAWQLHEIIVVSDVKKANEIALQALAGGADSLQFVLNRSLSKQDFHALLDSVFVEMIHLAFSGQWVWRNADNVWQLYAELVESRELSMADMRCSLEADPLNKEILQLLNKRVSNYSAIKIVNLYGAGNVVEQLSGLVRTTKKLLTITPELSNRISWSLPIGNSFMVEIAKLRAARILWASSFDGIAPLLHAFTSPMILTNDIHYNKIMSTTQAMSAIIGGADRLTVTPSDIKTGETSDDARRIARNVQHILRLESHFDKVQDPAAGSYYVEHLTTELINAAIKITL